LGGGRIPIAFISVEGEMVATEYKSRPFSQLSRDVMKLWGEKSLKGGGGWGAWVKSRHWGDLVRMHS